MIFFHPEGVTEPAAAGENLALVAARAGVSIIQSCGSGTCGTCAVDCRLLGAEGESWGESHVLHACVAAVPGGVVGVEISQLETLGGDYM